jgi:hypothetical protein
MPRRPSLRAIQTSSPPPNAIPNPLSASVRDTLITGPLVWKVAVACANPTRAWTKGVMRVRLRALISGPTRKLNSRGLIVPGCVVEEQGGWAQGEVSGTGNSFRLKCAEKSPTCPFRRNPENQWGRRRRIGRCGRWFQWLNSRRTLPLSGMRGCWSPAPA